MEDQTIIFFVSAFISKVKLGYLRKGILSLQKVRELNKEKLMNTWTVKSRKLFATNLSQFALLSFNKCLLILCLFCQTKKRVTSHNCGTKNKFNWERISDQKQAFVLFYKLSVTLPSH